MRRDWPQWLLDNPGEEGIEPVESFDPSFRDQVSRDGRLLARLVTLLTRPDPEQEPKLDLLRSLIEANPSQKVIVFSTFADAV